MPFQQRSERGFGRFVLRQGGYNMRMQQACEFLVDASLEIRDRHRAERVAVIAAAEADELAARALPRD